MTLPGLVAANNLSDVVDRERAWDNLGLNISTVYSSWTPAQTTTALWLDAADAGTVTTVSSAVSQWNDKSGNNRNFTQDTAGSRPAYTASALNGLSAVTPDGSNDWLTGPVVFSGATPSDYFLIAAVKILNITDVGANTGNGLFYQTGSAVLNSNVYLNLAQAPNFKVVTDLFPPTGGSLSSATTIQSNTSYIFATSRLSGTRVIWIDSVINATQSSTENYSGNAIIASDLFMLRGTNNALNAHVGEVIALQYPSTLNRQKLEGYLAHKWGLTANLPVDHPYRNIPPAP
jgi:hypothetical protein